MVYEQPCLFISFIASGAQTQETYERLLIIGIVVSG